MMTTLFVLTALAAAGLFTELLAASHAPLGYQDETGFHFGPEFSQGQSFDLENPSKQTFRAMIWSSLADGIVARLPDSR